MKKLLSLVTAMAIILPLLSLNASAAQNVTEDDGDRIVIYKNTMTEEERFKEYKRQIIAQLEEQGLDVSEFAISFGTDENIMPLNNIEDYKTVAGKSEIVDVSGYAGNQPAGGTRFETGGSFLYVDSKGPTVTISVNLTPPTKKDYIFPLSVTLGVVGPTGGDVTGYIVNVPNTTGYYKCHITKQYRLTPYTIYFGGFDEATWSYTWSEWSGGTIKEHLTTSYKAEKVS